MLKTNGPKTLLHHSVSGGYTLRDLSNFIYDTSEDWGRLKEVHAQQLANRMAADTDRKGEQEEAVFTSGAAVGTESFIRRLVESEEEAFPTGHKTPPVCFTVGDNKLKTLRNLRALRKR